MCVFVQATHAYTFLQGFEDAENVKSFGLGKEPASKRLCGEKLSTEQRAHSCATRRFEAPLRRVLHHFERLYSIELKKVELRVFSEGRTQSILNTCLYMIEAMHIVDPRGSVTSRTINMTIGALLACDTIERGLFKPESGVAPKTHKATMRKLLLEAGRCEAAQNVVSNILTENNALIPTIFCERIAAQKGTVVQTPSPGYAIETNYDETCTFIMAQMLAVTAMESPLVSAKFKQLRIPFRGIECEEESVQAKRCIHHLFMYVLTQLSGTYDKKIGEHMVDTFTAFHRLNLFPHKDAHFNNVAIVLLMLQCTGQLSTRININALLGLSNSWQSNYFPDDPKHARVLQSKMKLVAYFVAMASKGTVTLELISKIMTCHASLLMTNDSYAMHEERDMFKRIEPIIADFTLKIPEKEQRIHAAMIAA